MSCAVVCSKRFCLSFILFALHDNRVYSSIYSRSWTANHRISIVVRAVRASNNKRKCLTYTHSPSTSMASKLCNDTLNIAVTSNSMRLFIAHVPFSSLFPFLYLSCRIFSTRHVGDMLTAFSTFYKPLNSFLKSAGQCTHTNSSWGLTY